MRLLKSVTCDRVRNEGGAVRRPRARWIQVNCRSWYNCRVKTRHDPFLYSTLAYVCYFPLQLDHTIKNSRRRDVLDLGINYSTESKSVCRDLKSLETNNELGKPGDDGLPTRLQTGLIQQRGYILDDTLSCPYPWVDDSAWRNVPNREGNECMPE